MDNTIPVREARLKPNSADTYPTLPVSRWTRASALAELVVSWNRFNHPEESGTDRRLLEADFEFRDGRLS